MKVSTGLMPVAAVVVLVSVGVGGTDYTEIKRFAPPVGVRVCDPVNGVTGTWQFQKSR